MKKLLPVLAFLLLTLTASGKEAIGITSECIYELVDIAPKSNDLSQNPVILIDYRETDYGIFNALKNAVFCMVDNKGRKVKLEVLEIRKAFHSTAQLLLKPRRKLKKGRTVHIEIQGLDFKNKKAQTFANKVQTKRWKVSYKKDKIAPRFTSGITTQYANHLNSSASFHGIHGTVTFEDNYEYIYKSQTADEKEIIVEVTNKQGESILIPTLGDSFWLIDGMCGASFELQQDTTYNFTVRLMDMSGNKSTEIKQIQFNTGNTD